MLRVSNKSCIRELAQKSFLACKTRNIIAIVAIALTTILFTSIFTIAMSINTSFQESNFRQVGGYAHGGFKYLTEEQFAQLKDDPLIADYAVRRLAGFATGDAFCKNQVEISFSDPNCAKWMYLDPVEGRLPQEGTNEAATDLEVLKLLGVEPQLGAEFTIPIDVDGQKTSQTFTLCGWWEKDPMIVVNHVLIPESRVNTILDEIDFVESKHQNLIGSWNMNVMFKSTHHIERNLNTILQNHGYQSSQQTEENYIAIGVNWGYTGAQIAQNMDFSMMLTIVILLLLIILTGYLMIYNIFQISVVHDIRFYGTLKTIGTTGKQIKALLRQQAGILCMIGIPIGLFLGWQVGAKLTPVILSRLNDMVIDALSMSPMIFIGAAAFSVFTVFLSCAKPGRIAARVSPIEAVRYTEGMSVSKRTRKGNQNFSVFDMAFANIRRNKSKTLVTILSLTLAVVLLQTTALFTNGFDMDKYLDQHAVSDFIVADARYFHSNWRSEEQALSPEVIETIQAQGDIKDGGVIYGQTTAVVEYIPEEYYRKLYQYRPTEEVEQNLQSAEKNEDGQVMTHVQTFGMEPYVLDRLQVVEGDVITLHEPNRHAIAAVYEQDDYGKVIPDSHWAQLGDIITLRKVDVWEYYDLETGEIYESREAARDRAYGVRPLQYTDTEFEVTALVMVPHTIGYRWYGNDQFVLNDTQFKEMTGTDDILLYAFDTTEETREDMEHFLQEDTNTNHTTCDYESKLTYQNEFQSFRTMFLMLGGILSFIIGIIGILNFFNVILTSIITRKREFAMLQSIGMTGKQLRIMLVWEGLFYALGSVLVAFVLFIVLGPLAASVLSGMFWFFTYRPTWIPLLIVTPIFALLGCIIPLIVYHSVSKQTIVERLRETED